MSEDDERLRSPGDGEPIEWTEAGVPIGSSEEGERLESSQGGERFESSEGGEPTGAGDEPLAAVVHEARTEVAIESLRTEGVYDDDRRVRAYGDETVALPVTAPPTETRARTVIRQIDPEPRTRDLADLLADRGWSDAAIECAPSSWAVIGSVILVELSADCPDEIAVGEALLGLHGEAKTVLADEGVAAAGTAGRFREPRTRHVAGDRDTETVHTEHGTRYALDPARVMFSPGNQHERARMGELVEAGDRVFDMFAGIGYFTLPMARAGARVTAAEINPTAFRYLLENAVLNDVADRVDAYHEDCRAVAAGVSADRVVMGYYGSAVTDEATDDDRDARDGARDDRDDDRNDDDRDDDRAENGTGAAGTTDDSGRVEEAHEYLAAALSALEPGGVVHYHEATPEPLLWDRPIERLEAGVEASGRSVEVLETHRVKSHSAGVAHVVVDARVE